MSTKRFNPDLVKVQQVRSNRDGHWQFQNEHFSGTIYEYSVEDKDFRALNKWTFEIRVPDKFHKGAYVVVRPTTRHPQKTYWAGLDRESINLARATKGSYREQMYAKINLSDVTGEKNKIGVSRGQRADLPDYIRRFLLRLKKTVASTKGRDGNYQVAVIEPEDHEAMIRLFFALKVWVRYDNFSLPQ
jgi:hypothetical protein